MQGVFTTPVLETCYIVKAGGHDSYKELMAQLPDLTNGQDFSDGVDAMALPGIPEFAEMRDWTDGARYYTGATDRRAKESLGDVIQRRYGDNVGNIRQSRASRIASTGSPPNRNR